jgi:hypothetical protein
MDERALQRVLKAGGLTAEEILRQTPADRIDEVMTMLKRHRPAEEVCRALYERIGKAPLEQFELLKAAYFKHCAP